MTEQWRPRSLKDMVVNVPPVENSTGRSMPDVTCVPELAGEVAGSLQQVLQGKAEAIQLAVMTLLAGGHLLLEDVPGVGKTTLVAGLARCIDAESQRIQFTSDMLPTDVTGVSIYDQDSGGFQFHRGPVFTHIVIGDEINRATPKTQSALLEAMAEGAVSVDGVTHPLPELFMVAATQNPQDMEGTFALPEAQRDRFMARISLGYPDAEAEVAMLAARAGVDPADGITPVASVEDVLQAQRIVAQVHMATEVARYAVAIVAGTRAHPGLRLGASPRASLHLTKMAQARAAMHGRDFVSPDDVAVLASEVLAHRVAAKGRFLTAGEADAAAEAIIAEIVAAAPVG